MAKNMGPLCEEFVQRIRTHIGTNSASYFRKGGALASMTWQDNAKVTKTTARVEAGWGGKSVAYGYVLERGPFQAKSGWPIAPKGVLVADHGPSPVRGKIRRAGEPILALRFTKGNRVYYRKNVWHKWDQSMLRPHWAPAIEANRVWFENEWKMLTAKAINLV